MRAHNVAEFVRALVEVVFKAKGNGRDETPLLARLGDCL